MGGNRLEHGDAVPPDRQVPGSAQDEQGVRAAFFGRGGFGRHMVYLYDAGRTCDDDAGGLRRRQRMR
jgi:hypothetical protein